MANQKELEDCYDFVMKLTLESAKIIREAFQGLKDIETKAGDWDLVTQFDKQVENVLVAGLVKKFPNHKFIGEETVSSSNYLPDLTNAPTWIIDPIDGTTNFVHSFPHTCISIALVVNKQLEIGIVYNPILEQMFSARRGRGAYLNGKPIRSSSVDDIRNSLICIEASYAAIEEIRDVILGRLEAFVSVAHGIRTLGSAALTLCHVAMGAAEVSDASRQRWWAWPTTTRCYEAVARGRGEPRSGAGCGNFLRDRLASLAEVYHCDNLYPWDVAAGVLIIREAGGTVVDTKGGELDLTKPRIVAVGNQKMGSDVVKLIQIADAETLRRRTINASAVRTSAHTGRLTDY